MKSNFKYLIGIVMILSSCNKEDIISYPVIAGKNGPNLIYNELTPPHGLNLKLDFVTNYYFGSDSLDINLDGNFDLVINQKFQSGDNLIWDEITNSNFPHLSITLKNCLQVAVKTEIYYIGLGQTSTVNWVDTIQYGKRIDIISKWSESDTKIWMWVVPPTSLWGSYGCWYNLSNTEMYLGIRMKVDSNYKFGWVRIKQISRKNIYLLSYAIEK